MFYQFFNQIFQGFTGFYLVLPVFLSASTRLFKVLPGSNWFTSVLPGFTGFY